MHMYVCVGHNSIMNLKESKGVRGGVDGKKGKGK